MRRPVWLLLAMFVCAAPCARATVWTVGPVGAAFQTLAAAVAVAAAGDTIQLQAGTYTGTDGIATINQQNLTIEGIGGDAILDAHGTTIPNGKAIVTVNAAGLIMRHIGFAGAAVPDMNGAGIRLQAPGTFTCDHCTFTDNQDGILTYANPDTDLVILNSTFADNGACDGRSHAIYAGAIGTVQVLNSAFSGTCIGHDIKSRAGYTMIEGNYLSCGLTGSASYQVDLPNGGVGVVRDNCLGKAADADNDHFISFGTECPCYENNALTIADNNFINPFPLFGGVYGDLHAILLINMLGVAATVSGNTYCGPDPNNLVVGLALLSNNSPSTACLATTVPEPRSALLLGAGLVLLVVATARRYA